MTPTDLKSEISDDPAGVGYKHSDGTWKEPNVIAGLINDTDPGGAVVHEPLPGPTLARVGAQQSAISPIESDAGTDSSSTQDVSKAAMKIIGVPGTSLDLDEASERQLLGALLDNGVITQEQHDAIVGEAQRAATRAEALWGRGTVVHHSDVTEAKSS